MNDLIDYRKIASEYFNPEQIASDFYKTGVLPNNVLPIKWAFVEPKWKDKISICGYIHDGMIYFFYSVAKQLWEQNKPEPEDRFKEREVCSRLVKDLYAKGDLPYTEVQTTYGYIDILTKSSMYEVKYDPSSHDFLMALGQLLAYSKDYPNHKLVFASNKDISKYELRFKKLFESFNIEVIQI